MTTTDVLIPSHPLGRSSLTPRTPRFPLEEARQEEPLLASSSSFPHREETQDDRRATDTQHRTSRHRCLPIAIGRVRQIPAGLLALVTSLLLTLVILSYRSPDLLLGMPSPPSLQYSNSMMPVADERNLIDYSEYASFPLKPLEYAAECWKMHQGLVHHMSYWAIPEGGIADVAHRQGPSSHDVCNTTVTFQLDPFTGLFAQLALLAQVAALAREVCVSNGVACFRHSFAFSVAVPSS